MQIPDFLDRYPLLLLVVAVGWVIRQLAVMAAETSPSLAKVLGPLGRRGRRQAAREERDAVLEAMQRDINRLDKLYSESVKREREMQNELDLWADYDVYRTSWMSTMRDRLLEQNITIPPPPLMTRSQWVASEDLNKMRVYQGSYGDSVERPNGTERA